MGQPTQLVVTENPVTEVEGKTNSRVTLIPVPGHSDQKGVRSHVARTRLRLRDT